MTITRYAEPALQTEAFADLAQRRGRVRRRLVVLGLCIAVLGVAALVGRAHQPAAQAETPDPSATSASSVAPSPAAQPTVPPRAEGAVAGVPVGYPRTRAGAESAAVNYAVAYGSAAMFVPAQRHAIVAAIAAPQVARALQAQLDATFGAVSAGFGLDSAGQPPDGVQLVVRTLPVGARTVSFTNDKAVAEVWTAGLVGLAGQASTKPVTEAWSTITVSVVWTGGDWRWESFTQRDGPTPVAGYQPPSGAEAIAAAANDFTGFRYVR
jgi:hypothetical protein